MGVAELAQDCVLEAVILLVRVAQGVAQADAIMAVQELVEALVQGIVQEAARDATDVQAQMFARIVTATVADAGAVLEGVNRWDDYARFKHYKF